MLTQFVPFVANQIILFVFNITDHHRLPTELSSTLFLYTHGMGLLFKS